jgi:hypothetical protein
MILTRYLQYKKELYIYKEENNKRELKNLSSHVFLISFFILFSHIL